MPTVSAGLPAVSKLADNIRISWQMVAGLDPHEHFHPICNSKSVTGSVVGRQLDQQPY